MRRLIIAGSIALVVALAVLYTAGWRYARARMVEEVGAQMEALRADGYRVDWTDTTTGGFPFRVDVSLAAPAIASPPGPSAWSWSADALVFSVTPRDPTSVEIAPAGLQSVRPPQGELLAVASEDARVRVSTQSGEITRVAADARSLVISEAVNGRIIARATSGRAVLAREAGTDPAHNAVLTARGFEWAARPGGAPADIDISLSLTQGDLLAAFGAPSQPALRAWAQAGGLLTISQAQVSWGDPYLDLSGDIAIDEAGDWDGRLRLTAREPARVFARLAELGFLDEEAARQVGAVADSMAQDGAVTAPVRLSRGAIFFMGLPVGMAPPAF